MEEKTAKIPSLKEFKESRKERDAHTQRSSSMQTKKQMQKSIDKNKVSEKKRPSESRRPSSDSGRTRTNHTAQNRKDAHPDRTPRVSAQGAVPPRAKDSQRTEAPRTYARDRLSSKDSGESRSRSARSADAPLRQYRSSNGLKPRRSVSSERRGPTPVPSNKPPQKPKKPLSPMARKFRSYLVYASIILVVVLIGAVLSLTVLFKTENIVVSGTDVYSAKDIIDASGLILGDNIFTAPKGRASDRIEKKFTDIEEAKVTFSIPDTIKIHITMAKPAYVIEGTAGYYLVSDMGKVLSVSATDDEAEVPLIEGVSAQSRVPGEYVEYQDDIATTSLQEMFRAFRELECEKITIVNVETTKGGTLKFRYVYDDRIVVYLGTPDNLSYKIHAADTILKEKIDVNDSSVAGTLDASSCYETKKCYFNEYSILPDSVPPTTSATEATEATENTEPEYYG